MSAARTLGVLSLLLVILGCSEKKPAPILVWDFANGLNNRRAALTAVVAPPGGPVLAIGYDRPEGRVANTPVCFQKVGRSWTSVAIAPASTGTSTVIHNADVADDGSVWACGRTADYEPEPSLILPVVYHYAGGTWSEFPVTGADDFSGIDLLDLQVHGSGSGLVIRAVGTLANGTAGAAITYASGHWTRDAIPPPPTGGSPWWLATVARDIDGKWYAAGARFDAPGGALYVDDGAHGWTLLPGTGAYPQMRFTAMAFDPQGNAWLAGNYAIGDSLQGALFRGASGSFAPAAIARGSSGGFQIQCLGFDDYGNGWLAGRRSGSQPFLAGASSHGWSEVLTQVEPGEIVGNETFITGNTIHGVCGAGAQAGYAVGYAEVLDFEGLSENEAFIYELIPRPPGEIDHVRPDPGPLRVMGPTH